MVGSFRNKDPKDVALDFLERAGWSAAQAFFAVLLLEPIVVESAGRPYKLALSMAIGAAIVSITSTAIQYLAGLTDLSFWSDTIVRVIKTFLASLGASFGAEKFDALNFSWDNAIDVAFVAALGALGKALLARNPSPEALSTSGVEYTRARLRREGTPSTLPTSIYCDAIQKPDAPHKDDQNSLRANSPKN